MTLETASFIAQIVGGIAVVLSLVYVGIQIKQNTKAARMAAAQTHQAMFGNIEELFIADQQLVDLVLRASRGEEVSPVDQWRLTCLFRHVLRTWQTGHFMYATGALEKSYLADAGGAIRWNHLAGSCNAESLQARAINPRPGVR
jgi:hypothetical protein